jgi:hypothetical protein
MVAPYTDKELSLVVDAALLVNAAVGIADGEWTRKEAGASNRAFERVIATSRSHLIRDALMFFHSRESAWLQLSRSPKELREAMKKLVDTARARNGTPAKARKFYKPVADAVGAMLTGHPMPDRMRVVGFVWYVGLATASADGPFFGEKVSDVESTVIEDCSSDLASAAGVTLRECLAFMEAEQG